MSEPLEFREEAKALSERLPLVLVEPDDETIVLGSIESALREAAAKALQDFRDFIRPHARHMSQEASDLVNGYLKVLDTRLASLRTPSAPNAPKEAE